MGGGPAEAASIERAVRQVYGDDEAALAVEVWDRVERAALPEIYSRSTVVCIPSLREQFGMVAVEAMMCGAPVVASRVGGLQDLVVNELTGYLVDRLNPPALAAALAQFVRNPDLSLWMGRNALLWCRDRFEVEAVARRYVNLYETLKSSEPYDEGGQAGAALLRRRMMESARPGVERLLGSPLNGWRDVSSSPTPSFVVETKDGRYFVKLHQMRPVSLTCLTLNHCDAQAPSIPEQRIKVARLVSAAPVAPRVVSADEGSGILIQEPLFEETAATGREAEALMLEASEQFQSLVAVEGDEAEQFLAALRHAATATDEDDALTIVDRATADLSSALLGVRLRLRQCHPQMELLRIDRYLRKNPWSVSPEFRARACSLIRFLISESPLVVALPRLQHGSMKREHLMRRADGSAAVCDLDHTGFYVGPHDLAHWFHEEHARDEVPAPFRMLRQIHLLAQTDEDRFLGAVWLAVLPIYKALWRFARGNWQPHLWEMQFLTTYPEAFRKLFIRSTESAAAH